MTSLSVVVVVVIVIIVEENLSSFFMVGRKSSGAISRAVSFFFSCLATQLPVISGCIARLLPFFSAAPRFDFESS